MKDDMEKKDTIKDSQEIHENDIQQEDILKNDEADKQIDVSLNDVEDENTEIINQDSDELEDKFSKIENAIATSNNEQEDKKSSKTILAIVLSIFAVIVVAFGVIFYINSKPLSESEKSELFKNGTYIEGVSIFDVNVSGKTMDEAYDLIKDKFVYEQDRVLLELKLKDTIIPVKASEIKLNNTAEDVLKEAMLYGREGNWFKKIQLKSEAKSKGKNFQIKISTDPQSLNNLVDAIVKTYSVPVKEADVKYNPNGQEKFIFETEQPGLTILPEGLGDQIKDTIENGKTEPIVLKYEEIQPTTKVEDLKKNMVLRSKYSTNVSGTAARKSNVSLAGKKINGKKVMPGEIFDIEHELGARTAANGWYKAGEFVNGELVDGYGGGICQASTTLFNAVIRADLEVVQRSSHSQTVAYVPLGFDAAISKGGPLFTFKNNTEYPIYIFAYGPTNKLTIEIYGAPLPYGNVTYKEYSTVTSVIPASTKIIKDPNMPAGKEEITIKPIDGKRVASTLVFYSGGKEVKRRSWNSTYRAKAGEKRVGTATTTTQATTSPTVTQ